MEKESYISEIRSKVGVNINRCYQCGKCSAGCALADDMDYPPSLVMRMLQTNDVANYNSLLKSETIWLCVSCQNCLTRCPMEIDIPQLMDYMREKSIENKSINKKSSQIVSFHKAFLDSVKFTGRLYEIGLVAGYKARTMNLLQDVNIAPKMFSKGKLPILPEMVEDKKQMASIFSKTKK